MDEEKYNDTKIAEIKKASTYKEALQIYYDYECEVYKCLIDISYKFIDISEGDILASRFVTKLADEVKQEKVNIKKTMTYLENGNWEPTLIMMTDIKLHDKFKKEM